MSVRRPKCKKCDGVKLELLKELNPDTHDLNMDVLVKCTTCGDEHVNRVMSHHTKKRRRRGMLRV
jgi:uncharacterized Zn finger protein